ncbi:MAG: ATP-binding cassette domain-containing protein [Oscillospiraceae bacterium]|nr:ATP-binding cassette domain-containing protein [Oscillospiraceae bacterium]
MYTERADSHGASKEVLLHVEHLSQHFKMGRTTIKAVDDVSFDVYKGEVFGLVGESGCGKTTTGRSIIRIYDPTAGKILFKGKSISEKGMRPGRGELLSKIQMIFQDPIASLNPRMTVREIIAEGMVIHGVRDKEYIDNKVNQALEMVGLVPEHADRYPHEFSGGQRQRVGVARAIVIEPELIIADEPISALDVSIQAQVINLLNDLRRKMGLTILFIAHDLSVVKYFSDRIAVMYYGKIVELASSDELFRHPWHPYTQSLLSAIPLPDPNYEKRRRRTVYVPSAAHDYSADKPSLVEVTPGHFVNCNAAELAKLRGSLAK